MTVKELHFQAAFLISRGQGDMEVAIDYATFMESENGTILAVESAEDRVVQGADDSGPTGPAFEFFVLSGGMKWHEHGAPL